ncbi:SciE type virulence protein [Acidisoma cellulosilytica]|uniref:SciE type virulence protein n=1 Tax=Acidisoma cellulosilyticum TaxID=2802395 RepID=A0A964E491_9PROT|nr:type VI secretion system accessory protein TagJ [Acidisoma cellulosilyticum]MCB8881042.1 SciE type virulence protein [Acidisoma cellulosilyticum]
MDLFRAGQLQAAITTATAAVRTVPGDVGKRLLLAELLLFAEEFDRADKALAAMESLDISVAPGIAPFRQLLRAEMLRHQTWREARLPEFLGEPTPSLTLSLKSLVTSLAGDAQAADDLARQAEAIRPAVTGRHDDIAFDDIRDTDDIAAGFLDVLTVSGRYFWVPFERIEAAQFHKPDRLRDLFWRRCSLSVKDGPEGDVYLPALYVAPSQASDGLMTVGRKTEWFGESVMRGQGQRVLLIGDEGVAAQDLGVLTFG